MKCMKACVVKFFVILSFLVATNGRLTAAVQEPAPPDLTHGGKRDNTHDWLLGPTGVRSWIFTRNDDLTSASRQILITAVDAGSPAEGVLRSKDVILEVNGKLFMDDARKSFGRAITAVEEKTGLLQLIRWRKEQSANVEVKLSVLGTYSDTAP